MRRNMLNRVLIFCVLLTAIGCKAHKQLATDKKADAVKPASVSGVDINTIRAAQLNFNTFSGRAKSKITNNNSSNDVTLNIRISKGKKIWISVTAIAGIEVARALITPDSLLVINKLQSMYVRKPFSYINTIVGDQLDYSSVEAIFVGDAIPQLLADNAQLAADSGKITLSGNLGQFIYKLVAGPDLKTLSTSISNLRVMDNRCR